MLYFLFLAAKRGLVVDRYEDEAEGEMHVNAEGRQAITRVVLRPRVTYADGRRGVAPVGGRRRVIARDGHAGRGSNARRRR